ncbi:SspB family protein [Falsiroseomonas sp.]|uniref:SspB family protein n=1 Tax=Falsiroseomonas sp. TaxID=2870721 RepID=UPI002719C97D|nr:ClpXP protease specificity-enhancing factor SspB [Falsiroseomonas sp.]MDO9501958.1 ClpXP protease specificity-enhancing factor SspB [Falsiroseomonas sp.]
MSDDAQTAESLIPYERWTDDALREVVIRAIELAASSGLPGEHHYYITFRTDHPGTRVPGHLKARYPQEMTVVLQHQYEGLAVDRAGGSFTVRLHFGGVPSTLVIPFVALTGFADPAVRFGLRFQPTQDAVAEEPAEAEPEQPAIPATPEAPAQVVSLDAFRRRPARD